MNEVVRPDVAVVGGGPAGLGAAIELKQRGVQNVTVFEREAEAGGIPRHCAHPPYGLREFGRVLTGPDYARRLREAALRAGVEIRLRHSVVSLQPGGRLLVARPEGALRVEARRVVLSTGARETPRSARLVSGDRPALGILNTGALQSYIHLKQLRPFRRPLIVGTELVSLSAIWTCVRHQIAPVAVVEGGPTPTARWPLGLFPQLLRIPVHFGSRITEIVGGARVEEVEITSDLGKSSRIPCDGILFTGQFVPEAALMLMDTVSVDSGSGGPCVDQFGRCSDPAYFAAGNVLRAIETAGWCCREGRSVGASVARDLGNGHEHYPDSALPPRERNVRVVCGPNLKFAVPQSLDRSRVPGALPDIQLRVSAAIKGRLTVRQGDRILWAQHRSFRPERRVCIPLRRLRVPPDATVITIAVEEDE